MNSVLTRPRQAESQSNITVQSDAEPQVHPALWWLLGLFLTAVVGYATFRIASKYFEHYPYFFDAISYSYLNARLYLQALEGNPASVAWQEWLANTRNPLRTVPLILVAPQLLAHQLGHMATSLPSLLCFLSLLGWTIYNRTRHALYALASVALFCALPGIYEPNYGFASYWLDLTAALWMASGALCLVNYGLKNNWKWLAAFAVFVSCGTLSRYVAAAYAFVICAPLVLGCFVAKLRRGEGLLQSFVWPSVLIAALLAALTGRFLIAHYHSNFEFYSKQGYCLYKPILQSLAEDTNPINQFVGPTFWAVLSLVMLINLALFARSKKRNFWTVAESCWLAASVLVFLVLILRAGDGGPQTFYAVPLIFFAMMCPAALHLQSINRHFVTAMAGLILLLAALLGVQSFSTFYAFAKNPSPYYVDRKKLDVTLADFLANSPKPVLWNTFFDEHTWIPSMESFYRHGKLPLAAGQTFFTRHRLGWISMYPELTPHEVAERVYAGSCKWLDMAVVFADPNQAYEKDRFNNDYSKVVSSYVSRRIADDSNWEKCISVDTVAYGKLVGYRNLRSPGTGYDLLLHGAHSVRP
ncbi:MAG TPA: hypothetical protein V6D17_00895 [Candidatus Obscuribacterales bacterium]